MHKNQSTLSALPLFTWFILFGIPLFGLDGAIAKPQPTWQSVFLTWLNQEPKDRGNGGNSGGRPGDTVCSITPTNNVRLWTTQPLLVWQGKYGVIGIRPKANNSKAWKETTSVQNQASNHLSYVRKALVPGKAYEWGFFADQNRRLPLEAVTFQIMNEKERAEISKGLQALETPLKAQKATQESIALHRVDYFLEKGLRADALQEMYSVKKTSAALKQTMQEIEKKRCQK